MKPFSKKAQRGCPSCKATGAANCKQCQGKTWMFDWYQTDSGWEHILGKTKR